jgi:DNA-binding CsgD family transcriptional regulator
MKLPKRESDGKVTVIKTSIPVTLSAGELQALVCYSQGMSSKETARVAGCSPETIKDRTRFARLKLGAKNTTQAVSIALRHQIIK